MRRTSSALVLAIAVVAVAQDQRPLPKGAPEVFVAAAPRVQVRVDDSLDPDLIRALARPGVTIWLRTDSNTLRDSTVEHLARFDQAWVQLRAPLKSVDSAVFSKIPKAGVWVTQESLEAAKRVPGVRRIALDVKGPLDPELARRLSSARPAEVRWSPDAPIDLLTWGLLRQIPGRRVIEASTETLLPMTCGQRTRGDPTLELHLASLLALSSDVYPCGVGTRVIVEPQVDAWLLQSLFARDPSVELVVEVGHDSARAAAVRSLLDRLELGPSR